MPDRSFEQQVKEHLADLKMEPGATVWQEVNTALRQDKKRRWLVWLLALVICCGGGGIWWLTQQKKTEHREIVQEPKADTKTIITADKQVQAENKRTQKDGQPASKKTESLATSQNNFLSSRPLLESKGKTRPVNQVAPTEAMETAVKEKNENKRPVVQTGIVLNEPAAGKNSQAGQVDSSVAKHRTETDTLEPAPETTAATASVTPAFTQNKTGSWSWNLYANGGKSGTRNSILKANVGAPLNYYSVPPSGNSGQIGPPSVLVPPVLYDAFSFNIGVELNKKIGKSNSIGFSLGYGLYQYQLGIGAKKDSVISASFNGRYSNRGEFYYKNADTAGSNRYTNHYHFLQTSVDFYTQFKLFKIVAARWQLGMGLAYLLGSNGLHYDRQDNLLFENNELLQKLQVHLSTGMDFGIGKQPSLYVGPQVRFFVSNLSKQPGASQYLFQPTFKATYVLPKKKK